ncbi:tetratricopeptide repeat protein [Dyella subtropica]|uniref:tetratricopeptide repeat protein n=1 Tax=Dyella subtropica TaxID=2992127 RepID=UPI00225754FB|nr:tetratricopeptide repeat protein [Dyella subtropica]
MLRLPQTRVFVDAKIRRLNDALTRKPDSLPVATELAQLYLDVAGRTRDARYYGYAQSVLTPWMTQADVPARTYRARIALHQYFHRYTEARADLGVLLKLAPDDAHAWFDLALLQVANDDAAAALRSCASLQELDPTAAKLCEGYVKITGPDIAGGYALLVAALQDLPADDPGQRRWTLTALADAAWRMQKFDQAEAYFRQAHQLDANATDVLTGYTDFLLERGRPQDALAAIDNAPDTIIVLMRRCLAYAALSDARYADAVTDLSQRIEQRELLGDQPYYAEEIRAQLYLLKNVPRGLALASENWRQMKTPLTARLLMEAALAAHNPAAVADVRRWLAENPGVYPALNTMASAKAAAGAITQGGAHAAR